MTTPLQLPPLRDAQRYAGLYVVQFAHGVSVGYTADEVATLLREPEHAGIGIFRIHRVDEAGCVELMGVSVAELGGLEAMIFASAEAEHARRDLRTLQQLAEERPLPIGVRAELIDLIDYDPPHAVCLLYTRPASTMVSNWLLASGFAGGDQVFGGSEAEFIRQSAAGEPIASVLLKADLRHAPRGREDILASTHEPLQR